MRKVREQMLHTERPLSTAGIALLLRATTGKSLDFDDFGLKPSSPTTTVRALAGPVADNARSDAARERSNFFADVSLLTSGSDEPQLSSVIIGIDGFSTFGCDSSADVVSPCALKY